MMKRIVTIQDISCFGKCSSTVALPLISAMGVEAAVIPTAVLSTHTGGFTGYTFRDLTADIPKIAQHWKSLQLEFDGIYTGYLGSREQIQIVSNFFDQFRSSNTKIVVDPVMGDFGKFYAGFTMDFVAEMRQLCQKADIIVPNLTEVSLLLGIPYPENYTEADVHNMLRLLLSVARLLSSPASNMMIPITALSPMTASPIISIRRSEIMFRNPCTEPATFLPVYSPAH